MKALVFAAGLGTRLKPITDTIPKALVPLGGKPLLYHLIMKLKKAGVTEIVINVHHFAGQIISYVHEHDDFGLDISFSDESDFLRETGGGILYAQDKLEGGRFLVHNVDIVSDLDIGRLISNARQDALAEIVVSDRKTQRYFLFDDDMRLVGWTNVATGEVRSPYPDLNPDNFRKYAFSGIHLISGDIFNVFEEDGWEGKFSITDFYIRECAKHPIYGVMPDGLKMMDIGKIDTLSEAERFIAPFSESCIRSER